MFQDYLDNLPVFLPRFAPIFYQICSDFGADLVLSDNTVDNSVSVSCDVAAVARFFCLGFTGRASKVAQNISNKPYLTLPEDCRGAAID